MQFQTHKPKGFYKYNLAYKTVTVIALSWPQICVTGSKKGV